MSDDEKLIELQWKHPVIGDISETVCPRHDREVRVALAVLGIGCFGNDGSVGAVDGNPGPGQVPVCLRCQAGPGMRPRQLLRQWFGGTQ